MYSFLSFSLFSLSPLQSEEEIKRKKEGERKRERDRKEEEKEVEKEKEKEKKTKTETEERKEIERARIFTWNYSRISSCVFCLYFPFPNIFGLHLHAGF